MSFGTNRMRYLLLLLTLLCFLKVDAAAGELKILVLIIASDDLPVYQKLQKIWRAYMHLDPEHVESYFIRGNPDLLTDFEIQGDVIWAKTPENVIPGVFNKTILSMEAMLPRMDEFDYVLRTNLSSFYVFPRLLDFLKTMPRKQCYCAVIGNQQNIRYGSGAGFILSKDLVHMLVSEKQHLQGYDIYDDMLIGAYFQIKQIKLLPAPRINLFNLSDWQEIKGRIPEDAFHFRVKNAREHLRMTDEVYIQTELLKMFYKTKIKTKIDK